MQAVQQAADELRARMCGDTVSYVVNRNINYTNVCTFKCQFCAFSKGKVRIPDQRLERRLHDVYLGINVLSILLPSKPL